MSTTKIQKPKLRIRLTLDACIRTEVKLDASSSVYRPVAAEYTGGHELYLEVLEQTPLWRNREKFGGSLTWFPPGEVVTPQKVFSSSQVSIRLGNTQTVHSVGLLGYRKSAHFAKNGCAIYYRITPESKNPQAETETKGKEVMAEIVYLLSEWAKDVKIFVKPTPEELAEARIRAEAGNTYAIPVPIILTGLGLDDSYGLYPATCEQAELAKLPKPECPENAFAPKPRAKKLSPDWKPPGTAVTVVSTVDRSASVFEGKELMTPSLVWEVSFY